MENVSLDPKRLRQFLAVADLRSFRRAAASLGMAQPPLTESIRKLEQALDVQLFDRTQRPVRLTAAGVALEAEARALLAQIDASVRTVQHAAEGRTGSLRVTYVGSAAFGLLPPLVRRFRADCPEVDVTLRERTTAAQLEALRGGHADIGFVRPPVHADDMRLRTVLSERLVVALPQDHALARRRRIALSQLAAEPFVTFPAREGPSFYSRLVLACEQAGFTMRVVQEAVQMHAIVGLVAAGVGVALVPESLRALKQPGVAYRPLRDASPLTTVELAAIWRADRHTVLLARFLECC